VTPPHAPPLASIPRWQRALVGYPGICFAALWGVAEATFFFVVPDVLLSFVAILEWPRTWKHVLAAIAGATLGGALLFHWASVEPSRARAAVGSVPFIRESMFTKADEGLREGGLISVFLGSVSGLPYKLYAVQAPRYFRANYFLLGTPAARAVRFLLVWIGFGAAALGLKSTFPRSKPWLPAIYAALWIASYALYWGRILAG